MTLRIQEKAIREILCKIILVFKIQTLPFLSGKPHHDPNENAQSLPWEERDLADVYQMSQEHIHGTTP